MDVEGKTQGFFEELDNNPTMSSKLKSNYFLIDEIITSMPIKGDKKRAENLLLSLKSAEKFVLKPPLEKDLTVYALGEKNLESLCDEIKHKMCCVLYLYSCVLKDEIDILASNKIRDELVIDYDFEKILHEINNESSESKLFLPETSNAIYTNLKTHSIQIYNKQDEYNLVLPVHSKDQSIKTIYDTIKKIHSSLIGFDYSVYASNAVKLNDFNKNNTPITTLYLLKTLKTLATTNVKNFQKTKYGGVSAAK